MLKPKLLLDENIGSIVANTLRKEGYDTKTIFEKARGIKDRQVLARALREGRILITLDKDFGKLVFLSSEKHLGILFLRMRKESPDRIIFLLLAVLSRYGNHLQNKFTTVSEDKVRMR